MATIKKIKKIETPIDQHETFVSLQKNFADSESNTKEKLETLYELQQVDNSIESILQLRGELPEEVNALENQVDGCKSRIAHLEEQIEGFRQAIESHKQEIVDLDADIEKYQKQLENISNSREYDSINKELENQGLLRQIAEKNIGEARMAIEDRKSDIEKVNAQLTILEEDLAVKKEELAGIVESTAEEETKLVSAREAMAAKLDERTLSAYNRIRESVHNHLAVVTVYNDACGGCFSSITPQRLIDIASGRKLIICEHCGRIIVATPEKSENA